MRRFPQSWTWLDGSPAFSTIVVGNQAHVEDGTNDMTTLIWIYLYGSFDRHDRVVSRGISSTADDSVCVCSTQMPFSAIVMAKLSGVEVALWRVRLKSKKRVGPSIRRNQN